MRRRLQLTVALDLMSRAVRAVRPHRARRRSLRRRAEGGTPPLPLPLPLALATVRSDDAAASGPLRIEHGTDRGTVFDQTDGTTCGSTALLMLAARRDPLLALWLWTGRRAAGWAPPFDLAPGRALVTADQRLTAAQLGIHRWTSARGYPSFLGTSPWDAARVASSLSGVAYEQVMVNDQDVPRLTASLDRVAAAVRSGHPVLLYVGAVLPRHVVLATGVDARGFEVLEPGTGRLLPVSRTELLDGRACGLAAFGGWRHLSWLVLPRDVSQP